MQTANINLRSETPLSMIQNVNAVQLLCQAAKAPPSMEPPQTGTRP